MPQPFSQPSVRPVPFASVATGFAAPPRTMLLVEDSRIAAEAVRLICRRTGIRLRRAETLSAATLHLKVYRPDIALIDLGLPDGSGLTLISDLAQRGDASGRIVAISGDATLEQASLDAGADAFLLKPMSLTQHLKDLTGSETSPTADLCAIDNSLGLLGGHRRHSRNEGADPMALRDDIRMAHDLLNGPHDPGRLRYAGQFLASVGRSLNDEEMARAAERAGDRGDHEALAELLDGRIPVGPPI